MRNLESQVTDKGSCKTIYSLIQENDPIRASEEIEKLDPEDYIFMQTILIDYYVNLVDFQKGVELSRDLIPLIPDMDAELEGTVRFLLNYSLVWVGESEELDISLSEMKNRLSMVTEDHKKLWTCYISFIEGVHSYRIGNYEVSEVLLKESLNQAISIGKRIHIAYRHLFLGILYIEIGEIDVAIENLLTSKKLGKEINNLGIEYWSIYWIGVGDLKVDRFTEATSKFNMCQYDFINSKRYHSNWIQAYLNHSLGKMYYLEENFELARENFLQSLALRENNADFMGITQCLFDLIIIELEVKNIESANNYLHKLEIFSGGLTNLLIYTRLEIARALILKSKQRFYDVAQAYKILKDILDKQHLNEELKIIAVLETCDILIIEYQISNNETPLNEIHQLLQDLNESIGSKKTSFSLKIEILLFRSQMFLLQGQIEESTDLLTQAKELVEKNQILKEKFVPKIERKQLFLLNQLRKWDQTDQINYLDLEQDPVQLSNYIKDLRSIAKEYGFKFTGN